MLIIIIERNSEASNADSYRNGQVTPENIHITPIKSTLDKSKSWT